MKIFDILNNSSLIKSFEEDFFIDNLRPAAKDSNVIENLVVAMDGAFDSGAVIEDATRDILDHLDVRKIVEFDSDEIMNYRTRRPRVTFFEDHLENYHAPGLALYHVVDPLGKNFLFLTGQEPDYRWEKLIRIIEEIIEYFSVDLTVSIQAVGMPVPHTRPLSVTSHSNRRSLTSNRSRQWKPIIDIPASFSHRLETFLYRKPHNIVGYVAHVPQYLVEGTYKAASVRLLEYVNNVTKIAIPSEILRDEMREEAKELAEQVRTNADLQTLLEDLEEQFETRESFGLLSSEGGSFLNESQLSDESIESVIEEVELFLEDTETRDGRRQSTKRIYIDSTDSSVQLNEIMFQLGQLHSKDSKSSDEEKDTPED